MRLRVGGAWARFFLAWATSVALSLHAQIPMSAGAYFQDFDGLTNSGLVNAWMNNQTLEGWYASRTAGNTEVTNFAAGDGSSIVGSLYSLGSSGSSDRALGTLASGIRFVNDTGFTRSNLVVAYTGEQWRVGALSPQRLAFSYRTGTALTNA